MYACIFFFFNDTATTEIYTLSLHDALPIWPARRRSTSSTSCTGTSGSSCAPPSTVPRARTSGSKARGFRFTRRSEEHTSELQSRQYLVCRLLLEKKKTKKHTITTQTLKSAQ